MCTNGFVDHVVNNRVGGHIATHMHHRVSGRVGYMAAFLDNAGAHANHHQLHPQRNHR